MDEILSANQPQIDRICQMMKKVLIKRQKLKQDVPVQVVPGLYLGNYTHTIDKSIIENKGITLIISCLKIQDKDRSPKAEYKEYIVRDSPDQKISRYFDEICDKIESHIESGKICMVNCFSGKSRSPTLVMAYLIKKNGLDYDNAYHTLKQKYSTVEPNKGFIIQLKQYSTIQKQTKQSPIIQKVSEDANIVQEKQQQRQKQNQVERIAQVVEPQIKTNEDPQNQESSNPAQQLNDQTNTNVQSEHKQIQQTLKKEEEVKQQELVKQKQEVVQKQNEGQIIQENQVQQNKEQGQLEQVNKAQQKNQGPDVLEEKNVVQEKVVQLVSEQVSIQQVEQPAAEKKEVRKQEVNETVVEKQPEHTTQTENNEQIKPQVIPIFENSHKQQELVQNIKQQVKEEIIVLKPEEEPKENTKETEEKQKIIQQTKQQKNEGVQHENGEKQEQHIIEGEGQVRQKKKKKKNKSKK